MDFGERELPREKWSVALLLIVEAIATEFGKNQ
jgi:hypothetical protein